MKTQKFSPFKEEGLRIVDEEGFPFESEEQRDEAKYTADLRRRLLDEAAWALETTYSLPSDEEVEQYVEEVSSKYLLHQSYPHS